MKDSIDFGSMDIPKLFRKLLIPTVLGMIFSAIFIITDGIFVGKVPIITLKTFLFQSPILFRSEKGRF